MASPQKVRPPSYEETMERLGRSPEHGDSFSDDQQSPDHNLYHTRIHNDQPSPDHTVYETGIQNDQASSDHTLYQTRIYDDDDANGNNSGRADGERRLEPVDNQAYEAVNDPAYDNVTEPATISHTSIQPRIVQPATIHLPADVHDQPARPTSLSPSNGGSTSKPKRHYTKRKDSKRSGSQSPGDPGLSPMAVDIAGNQGRDWPITTSVSIRSHTSDDYWQTSGGTPSPIGDAPIIMKPMQTHVGSDGKKYLRDTSIEVVEHEDHIKRNLEKSLERPTLPDSFEWFSILGIICCLPLGAYAFKRSRDIQQKFDAKDFRGAKVASSSARKWATAAFLTGSFIIIVFLFLLFVEPCPIARALMADNICPRGT